MLTGYIILPPEISPELVKRYKEAIPVSLLSHISFNKEIKSLAHSLAGRYILSQLLQTQGIRPEHIDLSLSEYKRPVITGSEWQFSISHSGSIAVCSLSNQITPGIDIEQVREIDIADFRGQFTTDEYRSIEQDTTLKTFYSLWTAKEAICKAMGMGLYIDLKNIEQTSAGIYQFEHTAWHTQNIAIHPEYICTAAAKNPIPQQYLHQLNIQ